MRERAWVRGYLQSAVQQGQMEIKMETRNGNRKQNWKQKAPITGAVSSLQTHEQYVLSLSRNWYKTGFMSHVLCIYSCSLIPRPFPTSSFDHLQYVE